MKNLEIKIDKITVYDQFDFQLSIRGLVFQLLKMNEDIYEYAYYLTFKKTCKADAKKFDDAWEMPVTQPNFFMETGDPFVINCCSVQKKIQNLTGELMRKFEIDEFELNKDKVAKVQSARHAPYMMIYKRSKSYKRLKTQYERTLLEYIYYFYKLACVFTASKYRIPLVLKRQFLKEEAVSLWLLNSDDDTVALLMKYIVSLRIDLAGVRELNSKKSKTKHYGYHLL
jgi:citrate synthase